MTIEKTKRLRFLGWTMLGILILAIIGLLYLNRYGQQIAEQRLKEIINQELPPIYEVGYTEIVADIWNQEVSISNLTFDPKITEVPDSLNRLFAFSIPTFKIELKSSLELLLEQKLIIGGVTIEDPEIKIVASPDNQRVDASSESLSIIEVIAQNLKLFEINQLDLQGGAFAYHNNGATNAAPLVSLADINFNLQQFLVDSTMEKRNFLNAESIELIINEETFDLSDGIHQFSFEQLRLSTNDSLLTFSNVQLKPIAQLVEGQTTSDQGDIYDISVPELALVGIDFEKTYLANDLQIRLMRFDRPNIIYRQKREKRKTSTTIRKDAILELISNFAPKLSVNELTFNEGYIDLDSDQFAGLKLKLNVVAFSIFHINIDPNAPNFSRNKLPFDQFNLTISNLTEKLPDQIHELKIDLLDFNAKKEALVWENISIHPLDTTGVAAHRQINLDVPRFEISGLDYFDLLFSESLSFNTVQISQPTVSTTLPPPDTSKQNRLDEVLPLLKSVLKKSWVKDIKAQALIIDQARLKLFPLIEMKQLSIELEDINLNEQIASWEAFLPQKSIIADDLQIRLPDGLLTINHLNSNTEVTNLTGINLSIANDRLDADVQVFNTRVIHFPIDSIIKGKMQIDTLELDRPKIEVQLKKRREREQGTALFLPFPPFLRKVFVDRGEAQIGLPQNSHLSIQQFDFAATQDQTFDIQELSASHLLYQNRAEGLTIALRLLDRINEFTDYHFGKLEIYATPPDSNSIHQFIASQGTLLQLNESLALNKGQIKAEKLNIPELDLKLSFRRDSSTIRQANETALPSIQINQISLPKINLDLNIANAESIQTLTAPHFSTNIRALALSDSINQLESAIKLVKALEIETFEDIAYQNEKLTLKIAKLKTSVMKGDFILNDWSFTQKNNIDEEIIGQGNYLEVKGLNLDTLASAQAVLLDKLYLDQVLLDLQQRSPPQQENPFQVTFDTILHTGLPRTSVKELTMELGQFLIPKTSPVDIGPVSFRVSNLNVDSTINLATLEDYFEAFEFRIDDITTYFGKKNAYAYHQDLVYQSEEKKLTHINVQVNPQYTKDSYSTILRFQEDMFDVRLDSMVHHHFSWRNILTRPFHLHRVDLHNVMLRTFRDKNVPHPEQPIPLVQGQLQSLQPEFYVDTLNFLGNIAASERPKDVQEWAVITFDDLDAQVTNITNLPGDGYEKMALNATGLLFDEGRFETNITFDLLDTIHSYKMIGNVGPFDLTKFNDLLGPIARLNILSGECEEVNFNIAGNNDYAIGEMVFRYQDLNFQIFSNQDNNSTTFGTSLLSFWANRLVKSNNPSFLRSRKGSIFFERNKNRAIFNLWAKSLLSGVVSSVGVRNNRRRIKRMTGKELRALDFEELFDKPKKRDFKKE